MGSSGTNKKKMIIEELVQGQEFAAKLQILFQKNTEKGGRRRFSDTAASAEELVQKILTSFNETLSLLMITSVGSAAAAAATATCNIDKDDHRYCRQSRERTAPKDKRGCYKRKKDVQTCTVISSTVEDGHAWRKYGQKEILNSTQPRSYFRCTRKYEQGCKATKQVQRMEDDSKMFRITYIGTHTCSNIILDSFKSNPRSITLTGSGESWEPYNNNNKNNNCMVNDPINTPKPKQESKEEITTTTTTATTTTNVMEMDSMIMWKDIINGDENVMGIDYGYPCSEITTHNLELDFGMMMINPMEFENYLKFYESVCPI